MVLAKWVLLSYLPTYLLKYGIVMEWGLVVV